MKVDLPPGIRLATDEDVARIEALQQLRAVVAKQRKLADRRDQLVHRARNNGATWSIIAKSLGVTQQAVSERYGPSKKRPPGESDGG